MKKFISFILCVIVSVIYLPINVSAFFSIAAPAFLDVYNRDVSSLKIKWGSVSNVTGYELYCKKPNGRYKKIKTIKGYRKTQFIHKNLKYGKRYKYKARAYVKSNGKRYYSTFTYPDSNKVRDSLESSVPSSLRVTASDIGVFNISWASLKRANGYELFYKESGNSYKKLSTLDKNKRNFVHKNITLMQNYLYKVRAYRYTKKGKKYSKWSTVVAKKCTNFLLDLVKPYDTPYYYQTHDIIMGGEYYKNGFRCMGYGDEGYGNVTSFNLKGKFKSISFISGIIDGGDNDANIYIYTDGNLIEQIPIKASELPKKHSVNLNYCSQLKICVYSNRSVAMWDSDYGIAELKVYK